jgi:hypothetical protein
MLELTSLWYRKRQRRVEVIMDSVTRSKSLTVMPLAIAATAVAIRIILLRSTHCTIEDAYITLRYSENIAHGNGFVYNLGERVLGTTTPLFTLIMALVGWIGLDALWIGKAVNILADGAVCYLLALLLIALGFRRAARLGALLYATASAPINFSIGGMETSLVTLAGLGALYAFMLRRATGTAVCLALLILLRIDGLLLAGVLLIGWMRIHGPIPIRSILIGIAITLPWLIFATFYFGSPIPTSAIAKLIVYQRLVTEQFPNLQIVLHQFVGDPVHTALFSFSFIGAVWLWRSRRHMRPPIVWLTLYFGAILISRAPVAGFGWYFVPPLPIYFAFTAAGLTTVWNWTVRLERPRIGFLVAYRDAIVNMSMALIALVLLVNLRSTARSISIEQNREDVLRKAAGEWLDMNVPLGSRIMTEGIGYIGYFSKRPILDMVGLVSPEVIPIYRNEKYPLGEIVWRFRPEYLLLRVTERDTLDEYTKVIGRKLIGAEYTFVRGFPENGSPALILYRAAGSKAINKPRAK